MKNQKVYGCVPKARKTQNIIARTYFELLTSYLLKRLGKTVVYNLHQQETKIQLHESSSIDDVISIHADKKASNK